MNTLKKVNKKLTTKFAVLSFSILLIFSLFFTGLILYQGKQFVDFKEKSEQLKEKEELSLEMKHAFNLAISEMRAYYAFGGQDSYFQEVMKQKNIVVRTMADFQVMSDTEEDLTLNKQAQSFYDYYFNETVPETKKALDEGTFDTIIQSDLGKITSDNIRSFQAGMQEYTNDLAVKQSVYLDTYNQKNLIRQSVSGVVFLFLLLFLAFLIRNEIQKIKKPLTQLTDAATKIAEGELVAFTDTTKRSDELGLFSQAFENMSMSIMENEEELQAQNEELIAQQETLQTQQEDLEEALMTMSASENELKVWNTFVNGLSNSLDKKTVLCSVVQTIAHLLQSDRGIVTLIDTKMDHASLGISDEGITQFLEYSMSTLLSKAKEVKQSYTIKRESMKNEKVYHTETAYSYDICIPIMSGSGEIIGLMVYTRYTAPYSDEELLQADSFSKQVAISLDNLNLFEKTEEERVLNQQILDNIKEGIQLIDQEGTIIANNTEVATLFGWTPSEMLQKEADAWIKKLIQTVEEPAEVQENFERILKNQQLKENRSFVYIQQVPMKKVIQVYSEPIMKNKVQTGTVLVHRDITKEHEVDAMKSEFVSTVSHELRTPLASVLGFTELMLNRELKPERQKKYLRTIYQEANRLTALINDFLDVQRMESGSQTYLRNYEDLDEIIRPLVEGSALTYPKHEITFTAETANKMVYGDKDKLTQVFTNLISNAIKYSPQGGPVFIRLFEDEAFLNISIQDKGLGIPSEGIDKVFSKFYRVDNSDRRQIGGTGLGLSIVHEIVKAHKGEITVESTLGEGSTFRVRFPLLKNIDKYKQTSGRVESEFSRTQASVRVVVVEDDVSHADLLRTELEESNFQVDVFASAEKAIEFIRKERPDVIVVDLQLGKNSMTGWELIDIVKKEEALKSIPVLISSASDEKERGKRVGASEYLIKPYPTSKLPHFILHTLLAKNQEGHLEHVNEKIIWDLTHTKTE